MGLGVVAGELTTLVTFEIPDGVSADGDGGFVQAWAALEPDEFVSLIPATANMLARVFGTTAAAATHLVELYFRDDITMQTRIKYGTRLLTITQIQNVEEADIRLRLACVESVS